MNRDKYILAVIAALCFFLISACSNYGKLRLHSNKVSINDLEANWDAYDIYYGEWWSDTYPGGIIFDPKNDNKNLVGEGWKKVRDKKALSEILRSLDRYDPRLFELLGPVEYLYGYMFLGPRNVRVVTKVVGTNSLWVSDLQPKITGIP